MIRPDFIFKDTPGWEYYVEEVFVSTYKVRAVSAQGHSIEVIGPHAEQLVERVHQEILQMIRSSADGD